MRSVLQAIGGVVFYYSIVVPSFSEVAWRFTIQPSESQFAVKVGKAGLFKVFGHDHFVEVRRYTGEVKWDPDQPEASSIRLEVDAASLTVVDEDRKEGERAQIQADMETKALALEEYTTVRFVSKELSLKKRDDETLQGEVKGELTLRGATRQVKIPLSLTVTEERLHAWGKFKIKGSHFGIEQIKAAGGTVKTKDELVLTFDLVGVREE